MVDDDNSVLTVVNYSLKQAGYEVFITNDPVGALPTIQLQQPNLLMFDYKMPEMTGIDLLQRVRALNDKTLAETPAIIMSGAPTPALMEAIEKMLNVDFIEKPFVRQELIKKVQFVLSKYKD